MLKIIALAVLVLSAGEALAQGKCVITYNRGTRVLENHCEGRNPPGSLLTNDESKALKEGRVRECVIETLYDPVTKKITNSRSCR